MQCPFDGSELQVVNRSGVDIDWCPSCKGVWLERGELDKLIDLVVTAPRPPAPAPVSSEPAYEQRWDEQRPPKGRDRDRDWDDDDDDWKHRSDRTRKHKKKNLLSEIFDF